MPSTWNVPGDEEDYHRRNDPNPHKLSGYFTYYDNEGIPHRFEAPINGYDRKKNQKRRKDRIIGLFCLSVSAIVVMLGIIYLMF